MAADPVVESLNALEGEARARFLADIGLVGDALLRATRATHINYALLGNGDRALHAHLQPRYADEEEPYRRGPVDGYGLARLASVPFDPVRDEPLAQKLRSELEPFVR